MDLVRKYFSSSHSLTSTDYQTTTQMYLNDCITICQKMASGALAYCEVFYTQFDNMIRKSLSIPMYRYDWKDWKSGVFTKGQYV